MLGTEDVTSASLVNQMLKDTGNPIQKDGIEEFGFQYKSQWSGLLFHPHAILVCV